MLSTFAGNLALQWLLTTDAVTRPTTWYVSLHTADPGLTGANEVDTGTDADYIRQAITNTTPSGKSTANDANITFVADVAATPYEVAYIGIWDAETGGNFIIGGKLPVPESVIASGSLVLPIGRVISRLT